MSVRKKAPTKATKRPASRTERQANPLFTIKVPESGLTPEQVTEVKAAFAKVWPATTEQIRAAAKAPSFGPAVVGFPLTGSAGPGRKDDAGKPRLHKIPPESISLILEHVKAPVLGTAAERYTAALGHFTRFQATRELGALAHATQAMLGMIAPESRVVVPAAALSVVADVLHFGAERAGNDGTGYGWDNWRGVATERYEGGYLRHLVAIGNLGLGALDTGKGGSGNLHAGNGACCGLFMLAQLAPQSSYGRGAL